MHPNKVHHIKTYVVFSLLGVICVWGLIYLYLPSGTEKFLLSSSAIPKQNTQESSRNLEPPVTEHQQKVSQDTPINKTSWRRIRLTQILIRTQKELQMLEDQRKSSPQWLDPVSELKITKLREKIANIEKMITEIK